MRNSVTWSPVRTLNSLCRATKGYFVKEAVCLCWLAFWLRRHQRHRCRCCCFCRCCLRCHWSTFPAKFITRTRSSLLLRAVWLSAGRAGGGPCVSSLQPLWRLRTPSSFASQRFIISNLNSWPLPSFFPFFLQPLFLSLSLLVSSLPRVTLFLYLSSCLFISSFLSLSIFLFHFFLLCSLLSLSFSLFPFVTFSFFLLLNYFFLFLSFYPSPFPFSIFIYLHQKLHSLSHH